MSKGFDDLWILTESGTVIFNINNSGRKLDPQFFGMIITAVNSFSKTIVKDGLSKIELLNKRYDFLKQNELLFITCTSSEVKEKNIEKSLNKIAETFFEHYPIDFSRKWDGDVSLFKSFESEFRKKIEKTIN